MPKLRTTSVKIPVKIIKPGPNGIAILHHKNWQISINADEIRRLYYKVLGIQIGDDRSLIEIVESAQGMVDVDVPEDILRAEHVLKKSAEKQKG